MKEVKEQCEERIEEVTKKGNEAAASRDLSEQKDPSQQVTLGFSPKELPKVFLSSPRAFCPYLPPGLLLFPETQQPGPWMRGL